MNDELVDRCKTYAKYGQRPLPSWARAAFRDCVHRIEALTAQLAEARESERAAMTEVNGLKDALAQVGGTFERDDHD